MIADAITSLRATRVDEALSRMGAAEVYGTVPVGRGNVLVDEYRQATTRRPLALRIHGSGSRARWSVNPGWVHFTPVTWDGAELRDMTPQSWQDGADIYLVIQAAWTYGTTELPAYGTLEPTRLRYKTGGVTVLSAEIRLVLPGTPPPETNRGGADYYGDNEPPAVEQFVQIIARLGAPGQAEVFTSGYRLPGPFYDIVII